MLFLVSRNGSRHSYFLAYWGSSCADFVLQILLLWEIARNVLRVTGYWIEESRKTLLVWSCVGMVTAASLALLLPQPGLFGAGLWAQRSSLFTSLCFCLIFLAMSSTANRLGLPWRSHVMAMGEGFSLWGIAALLADAAPLFSRQIASYCANAQVTLYDAVLFFFAITFALPERVKAPLTQEQVDQLHRLQALVDSRTKLL